MNAFKKMIIPFAGLLLILTAAKDSDKERERVQKANVVLKDFQKMEESIPSELMKQAQGIVIIPKMINAGFGIGGKLGKGLALVKLASGKWSDPVFVTFTGGSIGFQFGVQAVDLVLVFRNKGVLTQVDKGDFTIGGDISAAAGPVGRSSSASTDYKLDAEVYSYSRSKGLFVGITINGSNIGIDKTANGNFYGAGANSKSLFETSVSASTDVISLKKTLSGM